MNKRTNTQRNMTGMQIENAFNALILDKDAESLINFVELYPHFTQTYVDSLLQRLSLINVIVSEIRKND